ncbi:hypothetical protein [Dinghuibacter silviterrae]|uniref:PH (Pleckstrin Homology) domain-containing protein n=1 Tax=Dinghuibacter silviterrae TaxID=1539049 RepID=A0A4R8DN96_9BACT|nr:hypothetical protein [Dinghuibacter silviterrae]TDW99268.1 hypothetical protein EDB95_0277 [Dinghuibacter silviterrae]
MEFKYFKHSDEGYKLVKSTVLLYVVMILFGLMAAIGLWLVVSTGKMEGLWWALFCFALMGVAYYRQRFINVFIQPESGMIIVKRGSKVHREYPVDKFMNFQKTRVRTNGIASQWHVSMYVDDNGKNKNILLGVVFRQKAADRMIAETERLLQKDLNSRPALRAQGA